MEDEYNSLTLTTDFSKLLVDRADSAADRAEFYEAIFTSWVDDDFNTEMRDVVTSMGLEYWYGDDDFKFALRTGFFYEDPSFGNRKFVTIGAGIRYDLYGFDFSYITTDLFPDGENHPLSDTLKIYTLHWLGNYNTNLWKRISTRNINMLNKFFVFVIFIRFGQYNCSNLYP